MRDVAELSVDAMRQAAAAPKAELAEELVSFTAPWSFEADQYRALRHRVEMSRDRGVKVVAVTSPSAGEGKTVTALNLAGALAQSPQANVLLIDVDFRRPAIARYLKLPKRQPALATALAHEDGRLAGLARRLDALNISVVAAGKGRNRSYDLVASAPMQELLREARDTYDFVIIDTPPLLPLPDARALDRSVDGFVLVVAAHMTPRDAVTEALRMINPEKLVAVAFNGDDRRLPRSYRYYNAGNGAGE